MNQTLNAMQGHGAPGEIELAQRAVAPRVSQADVDAAIVSAVYHVFPGTMLTVCCATMRNGYTVTGEAACASAENFQQDIGERLAYADAKRKVWPLLGYALRERLAGDRGKSSPEVAAPKPVAQVVITPTVGRVVWYFRQGMAPAPFSQPWDAHICRVNEDGTINVGGFDDEGAPYFVLHVPLIQEGEPTPTGIPWCEWMPYQQGQARK